MKIKILFLIFSISTCCWAANVEEARTHSCVLFVHGGYGYLPDGILGLTSASSGHVNKLASGLDWDIQAFYKKRILIIGLMYSGYHSKGELPNSSDNLYLNYLAPQAGMLFPLDKRFSFSFNGGFGCLWYLNKSFVYEKSRRVTSSMFAANFGVKGIYNISDRLGLSLEMMSASSSFYQAQIDYHNEKIPVKYGLDTGFAVLNFNIGLKYSF